MVEKRVPISDIEALIQDLNKKIYNSYQDFIELNKDKFWMKKIKNERQKNNEFIEFISNLKSSVKGDLSTTMELQECLDKINNNSKKLKILVDSRPLFIWQPDNLFTQWTTAGLQELVDKLEI